MLKVGDVVNVKYITGEVFHGEVVTIRVIGPDRVLFTVDDQVGYRSLYVDRCDSLEVAEAV